VGRRGFERGIELGQLLLGAGQADLQALDPAEPAFALGLDVPVDEVPPLCGIG